MSEPAIERSGREKWSVIAGLIVAGVLVFSLGVGLVVLPILQAPNAGLDPWSAICRAIGISPGTPAQRQPPVSAIAAPVSQVRWTTKTLNILASADKRPGTALARDVCANCHGQDGLSTSTAYPNLSGQSAEAIYKQLSDFRSGSRFNSQMTPVAKQLRDEDLAEVAAYYAGFGQNAALGARYKLPDAYIDRLARRGDPSRHMPPCEACHARSVGGPPEAPVLWGQQAEYLVRQLNAFASGQRRNDVYRRMRDIAERLSPDERQRLAGYYEGMR